jgi:predicted deacylase
MINDMKFKAITYTGIKPGLRLIVLGAVHGNETCGTQAIERIMRELDGKLRTIAVGAVTFVPITNPLAYAKKQRIGDRNLNRNLTPYEQPHDFEDYIANWLCPLLAQHDVLLDLHSFHTPGQPFAMLGPLDNAEALEPFAFATEEEALALALGVHLFVDGWLETYARGVQHRLGHQQAYPTHTQAQNLDVKYGVGTTEYMRSQGGWGITLECGQHDDVNAPQVAYQAIANTLAHLGLVDASKPEKVRHYQNLRIVEVVDKLDHGDHFARAWKSFDALNAGELIGVRNTDERMIAHEDARIVFPNPAALPGNEWFYLAKVVERFCL